jgi:hypothetical protein
MTNDAIDYINKDISNLKTDLQTISKLVRDGNGQPSLMQQVATLQNDIAHLEVEMIERLNTLETSIADCQRRHKENSKLTWQFKTAIAVALITSFTSIWIHYNNDKANNEDVVLQQILEKIDHIKK